MEAIEEGERIAHDLVCLDTEIWRVSLRHLNHEIRGKIHIAIQKGL